MKILLASSNQGKIKEFTQMLFPIEIIPQKNFGIDALEETGLSFIENALLKARYASEQCNLPAIADDSGLVVPALNGQPGIYSARYAGPESLDNENIKLLLTNLEKIPQEKRIAFFYCVLVFIQHPQDPMPIIATGQIKGEIIASPQGSNGFGYDPIFYLKDYGCTMAELSPEKKNTISHRGIALRKLKEKLGKLYE